VRVIKVIVKPFLGIAVFLSGLFLAYLYIVSIDTSSPLIFISALALLIIGVMLLIRVGKSGETIMVDFQKASQEENQPKAKSGENFLEKNAKLSAEWTKTVEKKDKLKTLEIAAAAEEGRE
jgi:hypothetical protein